MHFKLEKPGVFKNVSLNGLDFPEVSRIRQKEGRFPFSVLNLIFFQPQQAEVRE